MSIRKEKEKEFFVQHMPTFVKLGLADPLFIIKTAFFQKGKYGRQVQFFDSEIGKGDDVYVEFYDNVTDNQGKVTDIIPFNEDRQLFKYKYNPFYKEELETKEGISSKGEPYVLYTVATCIDRYPVLATRKRGKAQKLQSVPVRYRTVPVA